MSSVTWLRRFSGPAALVIVAGAIWLVVAPLLVAPQVSREWWFPVSYAFASAAGLYVSGWALWFRRPWARVLFLIAQPLCLPAVRWLGGNGSWLIAFLSTSLWLYLLANGSRWRSVAQENRLAPFASGAAAPAMASVLGATLAALAAALLAMVVLLFRVGQPAVVLTPLALASIGAVALVFCAWRAWNHVIGFILIGAALFALAVVFAGSAAPSWALAHIAFLASAGLLHPAIAASPEVVMFQALENAIRGAAAFLVVGIPFAASYAKPRSHGTLIRRLSENRVPVLGSVLLAAIAIPLLVVWRSAGEMPTATEVPVKRAVAKVAPPPSPPPPPRRIEPPRPTADTPAPAAAAQSKVASSRPTPVQAPEPTHVASTHLKVLERVAPRFPQGVRTSGNVFLEVVIDRQGKVVSARPLKGDQALADAAISAVEQWRFEPHTIGGKIASVKTTLIFTFRAE